VDGQRELAEFPGRIFVERAGFKGSFHPAKAFAESGFFIGVAEFPEQAFHPLDSLQGRTDDPRRFGGVGPAGFHVFQQETLKLAAILRTLGINRAPATLEGRAGLLEFLISDFRFLICGKGQPKRSQSFRVVLGEQLDIGKDDAIAAKAAFEAKRDGIARVH
jgi:hypothetical protein